MRLHRLIPLFFQKLIWLPTRLFLVFFGKLEIKGLENLKGIKQNVIFVMNHSSEIDPFMIPASLPFFSPFSPLFYPTREKKFYVRSGWRKYLFGGWFIKMWGGYTLQTGLQDYSKSLEQHMKIVSKGGSFCFFPEGQITPDGTIQNGKKGIAYVVHKTSPVVIPVKLHGAYRMSVINFFTRKCKLKVSFGKPFVFSFKSHDSLTYAEIRHEYQHYIDSLMNHIKNME